MLDGQSIGAVGGGLASLLTAAAAVFAKLNAVKDRELRYREQKEYLYSIREGIYRDELARLLAGHEPSERFKARLEAWEGQMEDLTRGR